MKGSEASKASKKVEHATSIYIYVYDQCRSLLDSTGHSEVDQ